MGVLHEALFHWPPWSAKPLAHPHQCSVLGHQEVLEFWPSVRPHEARQASAPERTTSEHPPDFAPVTLDGAVSEESVTDATNVTHGVLVAVPVDWVTRAFKVRHHLFPTLGVDWDHCNLLLLSGYLTKPQTSDAASHPIIDVHFHAIPPNLA